MPSELKSICRCPSCLGEMGWNGSEAGCLGCGARYPIVNGVPILLADDGAAPVLEEQWDSGAKTLLPSRYWPVVDRYRRYLRPGMTYKTPSSRRFVFEFAASFPRGATVANIGAGDTDFGPNVINLDIEPYDNVDVVGVAERLPLADSSCDGAILMAVLEHVEDADRTLKELRRIVAPGGRVLIDVPFVQGYHASPRDHRRYTEQGLRAELERYGFEPEASGVALGPASAMAWIGSEFLALLFSFQSARAYRLARLLTSWLSWPVKFADLWLERHPMAYTIASGVWVSARLRAE
jgi:SAM-dependent methyltransferase